MPVHETKGGYKYGETGKTYKDKKSAVKQAIAIAYSKAREKGRKPTQDEIKMEISGNPDKVEKKASVDYNTYGLRKLESAPLDYSVYGLMKLAGDDDIYGNDPSAYYTDPTSYGYQVNRNYTDAGGKLGPGAELKVGWNPFVRSKSKRLSAWTAAAISPIYGIIQGFRNARMKPGEEITYNPFENFRATKWHPANWFGSDLSEESGEYIMNERRKQQAMEFAGRNKALYETLKADLDARHEHNKRMYEEYGKIRPDVYRDPYQERRPVDPVPVKTERKSRALESNAVGLPVDYGRDYYDDGPSSTPNYEYIPDEQARKAIMAMSPEARKRYNRMAAGQ